MSPVEAIRCPGKARLALAWSLSSLLAIPLPSMAQDLKAREAQSAPESAVASNAPALLELKTVPSGAYVIANGARVPGQTPLSLRLGPGRHQIRVEMQGHEPQQIELQAMAGQKLERSLTLSIIAAPPAALKLEARLEVPSEAPSRLPAYLMLGLAGASTVTGVVFGLESLSAGQDYEQEPSRTGADAIERDALVADMAFTAALAFAITAAVLLLAEDPATSTLLPLAHGKRARAEWTF